MKKMYKPRNKDMLDSVGLRDYESIIKEAYALYCPAVKVEVFSDHYIIDGDFTNAQLRNAGRHIAKSGLGKHSRTYKSKSGTSIQLFYGVETQ